MNLTRKVLIALFLGMLAGLVINIGKIPDAWPWVDSFLIQGLFTVIGAVFINALKMLVVPLVIFSLIPGVVGISDIRALGRVGGKAFALYVGTTAIAISSALILAASFNIGDGLTTPANHQAVVNTKAPPVSEVLINIVPDNPIAAMANGEMLAVIFFSILFGISLLIGLRLMMLRIRTVLFDPGVNTVGCCA